MNNNENEKDLVDLVNESAESIGKSVSINELQGNVTKDIKDKSRVKLIEVLNEQNVPENSPLRLAVLCIFESTETSFCFNKKDLSKIIEYVFTTYNVSKFGTEVGLTMFIKDVLTYFLGFESIYFADIVVVELITKLYTKLNNKLPNKDTISIEPMSNDDATKLLERAAWSTRLKGPHMLLAKDITQLDILYRKNQDIKLHDMYEGPTLIAAYIMHKILHNELLFADVNTDDELEYVVKEYSDIFYELYKTEISPAFESSDIGKTVTALTPQEEFDAKFAEFNKSAVANNIIVEISAAMLSEIIDEMIKFSIDIRFKLDMVSHIEVLLIGLYNEVYENNNQEDVQLLVSTVLNAFDLPDLFDEYGENIFSVDDYEKLLENVPE